MSDFDLEEYDYDDDVSDDDNDGASFFDDSDVQDGQDMMTDGYWDPLDDTSEDGPSAGGSSAWIDEVKAVQAKYNISYKQAMTVASNLRKGIIRRTGTPKGTTPRRTGTPKSSTPRATRAPSASRRVRAPSASRRATGPKRPRA